MTRWPIRFVFVGPVGMRLEVKFPDFRDLRPGWSSGLPKKGWKVLGIEVKKGDDADWITGASAYSVRIVRNRSTGTFVCLDVWAEVSDGLVLYRWDRSGFVEQKFGGSFRLRGEEGSAAGAAGLWWHGIGGGGNGKV